MFNKIILIGRLGQNAEAKTAHVVLNIATQESWKNDKGDYETRTNGTASMPGEISQSSPKLSRKGSSSPWKGLSNIATWKTTLRARPSNTGSPRSMPPASSGSRRSRPQMIQPTQPATSNRRHTLGSEVFRPHSPSFLIALPDVSHSASMDPKALAAAHRATSERS
jgi:hypothetical protein